MKKITSFLFALIFANTINSQCPTFSISAPSGTVVGCVPPTVPLNAIDTSGVAGVTYTWVSASTGTVVGNSINGTGPNTYSVFASAPSNTCIVMQTISVAQSTFAPGISVSPISQTLTCNGACKSFTATSSPFNPNVVGNWFNPDMSPISGLSNSPIIMCANAKGVYTAKFCSLINGCCTSQTVSVASNTAIPTISVTSSLGGYTINCTKSCLPMQINLTGTLAPVTFTWIPLANPSASVTPATGGYTICTPGQYEAQFRDGNFCAVSEIINVEIDTIKPSPFASTNLSSSSFTINCFTPSLAATALTNPMFSASSYSWIQPPNLIINSNTVSIGMGNISGTSVVYTVSAMGSNGCVGKQKVTFYKDIFVPYYTIAFTPTAISCASGTIAMSPNNVFGSTVPVTFTMTSPPPTSFSTSAPATFSVPGTYTMTYQNIQNGCTAISNTNVPLSGPCGVNEINFSDQISIAPNPNSGKFNVIVNANIENAEIKIVNAIGQEVYHQNIKQGKNEINVGVLAKGIYHYSIFQNKEPVNRGKIIME